ncbi:MAG: 23S rRNA (adenine(2503)-C(2))-methyltransferase RlmN [Pseudomonadota bacterium]
MDLKNLTREDLSALICERKMPSFRAKQIFSWIYRPGVTDFSQMTDLAKDLRESLARDFFLSRMEPDITEVSQDGTIKYGFRLVDDRMIESVLIPEEDRHTLCVSSQVGCAMGCAFCLTGTMGFIRNLSCAEMVNQICAVNDDLRRRGMGGINNLVFMGMGEPLANFDNLVKALTVLMDELGINFSDRKVTVSTCGLVPKMMELANIFKVNLAVSLHAADNETRNRLMPVNARYPLEVLLDACRKIPIPKRKRIMFEYVLIKGVNDSDRDAKKLATILRGIPAKINLLPCNEVPQLSFSRPDQERIDSFQNILKDNGYTVLVRTSRGADISAACGQLAAKSSPQQSL